MDIFLALLALVLWLGLWWFAWDYPFSAGLETIRPRAARTPPRNRDLAWSIFLLLCGFSIFVLGIAALFIGYTTGQVFAWVGAALFFGAAYWLGRRWSRRWPDIRTNARYGEAWTLGVGILVATALGILILVVAL